jgi:hypothetical protein
MKSEARGNGSGEDWILSARMVPPLTAVAALPHCPVPLALYGRAPSVPAPGLSLMRTSVPLPVELSIRTSPPIS